MQSRVFEDNSRALEIAKVHKFRLCTKYINTKLHYFRDYITKDSITISTIDIVE